ncbi:MAG: FHA domain-containing protein [Chloroflexi bacterium]|nr:FHA domain-containing protein [Chloroflexota bacterium]
MPKLTIRWRTDAGDHIRTLNEAETCTIGRDESNDIILPDARVSRQHARVMWEEGGFHLANASTKNPLAYNIDGETTILEPGDRIPLATDLWIVVQPFKIFFDVVGSGADFIIEVECPGCGKNNSADEPFCKWCGHSLTGSNTVHIRK